jgi:3-isopropylmalate dehydrogenase
VVGVLPGEGIGPEVIEATLAVLHAVAAASPVRFEVRTGGPIGLAAERTCGQPLSREVIEFCHGVFAAGGAVLAGAGGGRFVYDVRKEFDLFCKLNPLVPPLELRAVGCLKDGQADGVDVLVVRENIGGVYQGQSGESRTPDGRTAHHSFSYTEHEVRRIVRVAAQYAVRRRGILTVVVKPAGVPAISQLWSQCCRDAAREFGVQLRELEIDYAAYLLVRDPRAFDVLVAANLFGDILSDLGAVLLGSRGLSHGGNFAPNGDAAFQTNHGAAYDLAGTDRANPVGQMLSLVMLLRDAFYLQREAGLVRAAIGDVWRSGVRTEDVAEPGCRVVGTREMGALVAVAVSRRAGEART